MVKFVFLSVFGPPPKLIYSTSLSYFTPGRSPVSHQIYFFDFVVSVGGEKSLSEDAKAKTLPDGLSNYTFQLKKQFFEPGELVEDPLAIELIYRQIVNTIGSTSACGFEGALTALAAFYFVSNDGKIPSDFAKKYVSSSSPPNIFSMLTSFPPS